ncbi:MAG: OmpH family outer membrane protein [Planctomycetota bacterium]|nr:OmpH family outer membrane protein [Planctomycetota bacterium]
MRNAVAVVALVLVSAVSAVRAEELGATKVAVVDVSLVFTNYKRVSEVQRQVDAEFEPRRKALEKDGLEIEEEEKKLGSLQSSPTASSDDIFKITQAFQKRLYEFRKAKGKLEIDIVMRMRQEMKSVLNDIRAAIRKEAEKAKFDLVLRAPDPQDPADNPGAKGPEDVKVEDLEKLEPKKRQDLEIKQILAPQTTADLLIRSRRNPVLYGAWTINITEAVLKTLNDDYQKRAGALK